MATGKNHTGIFKKILVDFISQEDPILAMLEWTAQRKMQMEAEAGVGAAKGEHSDFFIDPLISHNFRCLFKYYWFKSWEFHVMKIIKGVLEEECRLCHKVS